MERDLVYMIIESLARRELRSLLSSNNRLDEAEIEPVVKSLFAERHSTNWPATTVPEHVSASFSSPACLWSVMQTAAFSGLLKKSSASAQEPIEKAVVRSLLSENLTNAIIEEMILEFLGLPLGIRLEHERVRAHVAGVILGYQQLKQRLFEQEIPRVKTDFESINEGISGSFTILPDFLLLRPGEMADRTGRSLLLKEVAPGAYTFTLSSRFFTPKGSFILYQAVYNTPNQLSQLYIDRLRMLSPHELALVHERGLLDCLFGEGATRDLLTRTAENTISWNQERSASNTLLAAMFGLRYVARHYVYTNHPEIKAVIRGVLDYNEGVLNFSIIESMSHERLRSEIERYPGPWLRHR